LTTKKQPYGCLFCWWNDVYPDGANDVAFGNDAATPMMCAFGT